jgi:hypothetical protein
MSEVSEVQHVDAEVDAPDADSSIGGGSAAPVADDGRVVPQLDGAAETSTLHSNNGTQVVVTIVPQTSGKKTKRSWVWQVCREFKPLINGKNVFCMACKHLMLWKPADGTGGMSSHYKKKHPALYKALMDDHTTTAQGRANVAAAVGEWVVAQICVLSLIAAGTIWC